MTIKPFTEDAAIHDRGHVTEHNKLGEYLNTGGLVLTAAASPTSAAGEPGDWYIDTSTSPFTLYGPKSDVGWPAAVYLLALPAADLASAIAAVTAATDVETLKTAVLGFLGDL